MATSEQVPSVGRAVHYTSYGTPGGEYTSQCRAAVVTALKYDTRMDQTPVEGTVDLCVFNPEGLFFNKDVRYSAEPKGGTWHWPERV